MSTPLFIFLCILLAVLIVASYVIVSFGVTIVFGAPYVGTSAARAREMLKFVDLKPGETVLDIGSGNGSILLVAAQEFGAKKGIGIEINPLLVWSARARARMRGLASKLTFKRRNAFRESIPKVDVLVLYLLGGMMDKLEPKLAKKLDPNTRIISRGFEFSHVKPYATKVKNGHHFYLYRAKDLDGDR